MAPALFYGVSFDGPSPGGVLGTLVFKINQGYQVYNRRAHIHKLLVCVYRWESLLPTGICYDYYSALYYNTCIITLLAVLSILIITV